MGLTLENLLDGPELPEKQVYIDALQDTVSIKPVPLERYQQYSEAKDDIAQAELLQICIAESLSDQKDMTLEDAKELIGKVQKKVHPAAWDEISKAVMVTMFGEARIVQAEAIAGND